MAKAKKKKAEELLRWGDLKRVDFLTYQNIEAWNFSVVKKAEESLAAVWHAKEEQRLDRATKAQLLGRAIHCAVLEPERFDKEYVAWDGARRSGFEWECFIEQTAKGRDVISSDDHGLCLDLRDRVRGDKVVGRYLSSGIPEASITWIDQVTGLTCKARLDFVSNVDGKVTMLDLKTTSGSITPHAFGRTAAQYHYHTQMAWYRWGLRSGFGCDASAKLVAITKDAPLDCVVYDVGNEALAVGDEHWRLWLNQVAEAVKRGEWPGVSMVEQDLVLPSWAFGTEQNLEGVAP